MTSYQLQERKTLILIQAGTDRIKLLEKVRLSAFSLVGAFEAPLGQHWSPPLPPEFGSQILGGFSACPQNTTNFCRSNSYFTGLAQVDICLASSWPFGVLGQEVRHPSHNCRNTEWNLDLVAWDALPLPSPGGGGGPTWDVNQQVPTKP